MESDEFTAVVELRDASPVIAMRGTVTRAAQAGLEAAYAEAAQHAGEILLDFADVEYINSTGIAVIVGVLATARAESRTLGATGLTDHYREVFQITRLSDFMHIYEDAPSGS
jgi:anti-sigma B factor antagonist